jgi:3-oxoadipate enol-lactonase/4-carboxymuconolactone decarboxylase
VPELPTTAVTAVRLTGSQHRAELPLLVLGPALGSSATALWADAAAGLTDACDVVAWDLPGHGHNRAVPEQPFTLAELAAGVLAVVDEILLHRDEVGASFSYAGVGVGGSVGLQLLLDAPARVRDAVLIDAGARSGAVAPESGPVAFDVRGRLGEISAPVLAVAGAQDDVTPLSAVREVAEGVRHGRLEVLDGVTGLAPVEAPEAVARLVRAHVLGETVDATGDRHSRALVTLEADLRAALDGGLTVAEIEGLLHLLDESAPGADE